jgi:hypothetical protein
VPFVVVDPLIQTEVNLTPATGSLALN